jgi:DNA-binding transcriptional ArsR family regulator
MVEQIIHLDSVFQALADATRRDILKRVSKKSLSISELAEPYAMSFAAIAKHVAKLEAAMLVIKERKGKEQIVTVSPKVLTAAARHLEHYKKIWDTRFDSLENLLKE